ncbi:probable polygalacturonase At1g80170 [Impatiens glandulifera]|uniref:probable polygalacturonase At1g80170 n=1 Tax=Impatiens glandulifera TaxID=253017 RepID=UPI001FB0CD78|nr:probable polygalacturonase At1g80170 [Impatiens glandulifera]
MVAHKDPEKWECVSKGCKQWIAFDDLTKDLYISGSGTLDGRGSNWWGSYCENDEHKKSCSHKPTGFVIMNSINVHISGLTFLDSPHMHIAIERSDSVYVSNLTIIAPGDSPNTDGIHIQHSTNVFIEDTNIGTGDDCISIGPSSHINISRVNCGPGHGISVGSLGKNGDYDTVDYVYVSDINFNGSTNGARIKSWQGGHGHAKNIVFERINLIGTKRPIVIDQFYCDHTTCHNQTANVQVSDVWFNNIHGTSSSMVAVRLACSQSLHCKNINMKDINIQSIDVVQQTRTLSSYCINVQGKLEGQSFILLILLVLFDLHITTVQCRLILEHPNEDTFNVLDFGAIGDGITEDNQAFEKAWKATCRSKSLTPTLVVPSNYTFLLQPLILSGPCESNSTNVLINGTLVAHEDPKKWECVAKGCKQWIAFDDFTKDLYISGSGTIDGQGSKWWGSYCENYKHKKSCSHKPKGFVIMNSINVHISGLTFLDSPHMHIAIERSDSIYVSNLTIIAPADSPNTDGIHIQHSTNVFIEDTDIGTGDDCISIGPSSHINISRINCGPGHGISVGSLGKNGEYDTVDYIYVSDINFNGSTNGARIKSWQGGHGHARNIVFERINLIGTKRPIVIDQFYCDHTSCHNQTANVQVSDVWFNNIHGTSSSMVAVRLACSQTLHCKNINMKDINIQSIDVVQQTKTLSSYCINVQGKLEGRVFPSVPCLNY